jgi:hypothetical protein
LLSLGLKLVCFERPDQRKRPVHKVGLAAA